MLIALTSPVTAATDDDLSWTKSRTSLPDGGWQVVAAMSSDEPRVSRVIVATPDGRQFTYAVGDMIATGITVDTVERDYVVVSRQGRPEVHKLRHGAVTPKEVTLAGTTVKRAVTMLAAPSAPGSGGSTARVGAVEDRMAQLRASVTEAAEPLPPPSPIPLHLDRGRNSAKLAPELQGGR